MRLIDRYQPRTLDAFCGLDEPKRILGRWLKAPDPRAFLLVGESGTGKTCAGLAIARALGIDPDSPEAQFSLIRIASQECTVDVVRALQNRLCYASWAPFWVVLADEADEMTKAAQIAFLSLLDRIPARTVIVFTSNGTDKLEPRFLSRCSVVKFSNYGLNGAGATFLREIWLRERPQSDIASGDNGTEPDFARLLKNQRNNLRGAINELENLI